MGFALDSGNFKRLTSPLESLKPKPKRAMSRPESACAPVPAQEPPRGLGGGGSDGLGVPRERPVIAAWLGCRGTELLGSGASAPTT